MQKSSKESSFSEARKKSLRFSSIGNADLTVWHSEAPSSNDPPRLFGQTDPAGDAVSPFLTLHTRGLLIHRSSNWRRVLTMLVETVALNGAILFILRCASSMAWAFTQANFSHGLVQAMILVLVGRIGFLMVSIVALILGDLKLHFCAEHSVGQCFIAS